MEAARHEYEVLQVREGWQVKAITAADVKGRLGPGSSEGLLVTLERPV